MKMTRLRLKFLLPDVEAQQSCVWEGWGGAGCPELSSLQASCSGTTIFPLSQRGPARADRTPGVLSVTTVVTWLLSSVRGGGGGGVEGISSPGDPPQAWLSELQEDGPRPAWACRGRLLFCAFTKRPRTPHSL